MKNKITTVLLATLSLVLSGAALADSHDDDDECPGPSKMKLDVGLYSLDLQEKKPICVFLGGTFSIKIVVKNNSGVTVGPGDAWVEQKEGSTLTISGNNEVNEEFIVVTVEGTEVPANGISDFNIYVNDVGNLDPRVRVVDSNVMRSFQHAHIKNALNELGINFAYVTELFRDFGDGNQGE